MIISSMARKVAARLLHRHHDRVSSPRLMAAICCLAFIVVLTSLVIAAMPAQPAIPLITRADWVVQGKAFQNVDPRLYEIRDSIRLSPQTVYWRTWSPETLATAADIRTVPFKASEYMAVPYGGFAGDPNISVDLICMQDSHRLVLASARTNNQMTEVLVHVPSDWCSGDVVLDAKSSSTSEYVEIGTPFKISWFDYQKSTFIGLIGILVVLFAAVWGLVFIPNIIFARHERITSINVGVAVFGFAGYALFFLYFFSHGAGLLTSVGIFLAEVLLLFWAFVWKREALRIAWNGWKAPTVLWGLVVLASFCLSLAIRNGAGPWTTNALFTPVQWSSDNQIPMMLSEYLFHGQDPRNYDLGQWKISDRPPLAYGLMTALRVLSASIAAHNDGYSLFYKYQTTAGIVINGVWIVALYYLLAALKLDRKAIYSVAIAIALTPFAIFNSIYIWPKMLGAAFAVFAYIELFEPAQNLAYKRFTNFGTSLLWAAAFSALALLSHGGTAFGIIAAILVAVAYRGLPKWDLAVGAVLVGFLVLIPWGLWQHFVQPPGNALIKYALAGTFGFGEENKSILATMHDAYSPLTISNWIQMKLHALRVIVTGHGSSCGLTEMAPSTSVDGGLRVKDFLYFGPSLRFLAIGFLPLIFASGWRRERDESTQHASFARITVATGLIGILLYVLFGFDCYINHMQSYESMLEIFVGLVLALYVARRRYFDIVLLLSVIYSTFVWIIAPIAGTYRFEILPIAVLTCIGALTCSFFVSSIVFAATDER